MHVSIDDALFSVLVHIYVVVVVVPYFLSDFFDGFVGEKKSAGL